MIFNVTGGGGSNKAYAVITVIYPVGSLCTCSNGSKTLKAKDTFGKYMFLVPEGGTWTVSSTNGTQTASKAVEVTEQYQMLSVSLSYQVVLFENGQISELLGSLKNVSLGTYAITDNKIRCVETGTNTGTRTGYGTFTLAIDLTDKENLYIEAAAGTYGTNQRFGVAAHGSTNFVAYASKTQNGSETVTIPVGDLTGSYDVVIAVWAYGDYSTGALTTEVNVSKIWAV